MITNNLGLLAVVVIFLGIIILCEWLKYTHECGTFFEWMSYRRYIAHRSKYKYKDAHQDGVNDNE